MANTLAVAKYLNDLNLSKYGCSMDQMEMHKLMYFSQRESLMVRDSPLFDGEFEAWKYGPVLTEVRREYLSGHMFDSNYGSLTETEKKLVSDVFYRYESISPWDLSSLSHEEYSWKQARLGLGPNDQGRKKLSLSAMKVDAKRESLRRKGVFLA